MHGFWCQWVKCCSFARFAARGFGIGRVRPKVDSPVSSSPRLSRFARSVFVVLLSSLRKRNKHGKTVTTHVESKVNISEKSVHHFVEWCMSSGELI